MAQLDLQTVVSLLLNGLATASMLFIVASGLSLIFGVTQIVNFAHGSFYMLGAFFAYSCVTLFPGSAAGFWSGVVAAALAVAVLGALVEITVLRRLYHAPELLQLLATFGIVLIIQDVAMFVWGYEDLIGPRVPGFRGAVEFLGVRFPSYNLLVIVLGPTLLIALWALFHKTRWGTMVRAATEDREMLAALGVNQKWLFTSVFFLGSALAGFGGAIQLPRDAANLGMDFNMLVEAFAVVVIGGLGSVFGAFLASLLIGVFLSFGTLLLPTFTLVLIFLIMAAVLVIRPLGLVASVQVQPRPLAGLYADTSAPSRRGYVLLLPIVVVLASLPWILGQYGSTVLIESFVLIVFAASLHFLLGPGGILSFGHAAYFGIGAYAVAFASKKFGFSMIQALMLAPLICGIAAAIFGWFCIRLDGVYRALLTLAFAQIVWSVLWQWIDVTGGDNGILQVWPDLWARPVHVYYNIVLFLCFGCLVALWRIVDSPFGYALRAARDSKLKAASVGIPVARVQWAAFVIAGMAAGVAGALYAYAKGSVFPDVASIPTSVDGLVMVLLGGIETLLGPVVGATAYHWLKTDIVLTTDHWRLVLGLVIVGLVMLFPSGIGGYALRWKSALAPTSSLGKFSDRFKWTSR
jgi:branched-chain amino acid transport system permease protein